MKMFKKAVSLLLVAVLALGVVACKPQTQESKEDEGPVSFEGVTVTWDIDTNGELDESVVTYVQNPIKNKTGIDLVIGKADPQTLPITVAGGGGPDIINLTSGQIQPKDFYRAGKAVDMTKYAEKYGWKGQFYEWALDAWNYDGKLICLPTEYEGMGLAYNMDVMNAHGWTIPTTLDELIALCEEIKAAGLTPIAHGTSGSKASINHTASIFLNCCCNGIDNLKKVLTGEEKWNENKGIKTAVETMLSFYQKGYIEPNYATITSSDARNRWYAGECVILVCGTWNMSRLGNPKKCPCNWQFELFPAQKAGEAAIFPLGIGSCLMINANSDNPDAAAAVINAYFFEMQEEYYDYINNAGAAAMPVNWMDPEKINAVVPAVTATNKVMFDSLANGNIGYVSWSFFSDEVASYINDWTDSMIMGELTVKDYLNGLQSAMNEDVAEGNLKNIP